MSLNKAMMESAFGAFRKREAAFGVSRCRSRKLSLLSRKEERTESQ